MNPAIRSLVACVLVAATMPAQCPGPGTVGVAGTNNLTVEAAGGLGSCGAGTTKCLPVGPLILDMAISALPGSVVIGGFATTTV